MKVLLGQLVVGAIYGLWTGYWATLFYELAGACFGRALLAYLNQDDDFDVKKFFDEELERQKKR
jgi:hypothetical protein